MLLYSALFLLSSCYPYRGPVTSMNGPAYYNQDIAYQPKPLSVDSIHHATYISASLVNGFGANDNDQLTAGQLNLGMAYTLKHFNISYGAFGAAGSFHNGTVPDTQAYYFNSKFVGIGGGRASINYYVHFDHVDIRIIGLEAAYSHEFGAYADYRKEVNGQPYFFTNARTNLFTWGGSSEVAWYGQDPSFQFGLRLFVGQTNGSYRYDYFDPNKRLAASFAYFMQIKNAFLVAEIVGAGGHFTLGYRFQ